MLEFGNTWLDLLGLVWRLGKLFYSFFWNILKEVFEANKEGRKETSRGRSRLILRGRPWRPLAIQLMQGMLVWQTNSVCMLLRVQKPPHSVQTPEDSSREELRDSNFVIVIPDHVYHQGTFRVSLGVCGGTPSHHILKKNLFRDVFPTCFSCSKYKLKP